MRVSKLLRGLPRRAKEVPPIIHWYIGEAAEALEALEALERLEREKLEREHGLAEGLRGQAGASAPRLLGKLSPRSSPRNSLLAGDAGVKEAASLSTSADAGADHEPRRLQLFSLSGPYVATRSGDVYKIGEELGKGSFGSVYKASNANTQGSYAIKPVPIAYRGDRELDVTEDISLVKSLDHPHIIKFFESYRDYNRNNIVMEFCGGGSLKDKLEKVEYFREADAQLLMRQLMSAVGYLHRKFICHRDLKPDNILLQTDDSEEGAVVKIADFGFARRVQPARAMRTQCGTLAFCAPEVLKGRYQVQCDLWSCGVTMYLLMSGALPFQGKTEAILAQAVRRGNYGFWGKAWQEASEDAKALVRGLLRYNDEERLSARDALGQPFFGQDAELPTTAFESFARRLFGWSNKTKLQKAALQVIARRVEDSRISDLSKMFAVLDKGGKGSLSASELQSAFTEVGSGGALRGLVPGLEGVCPVAYTDFLAMALDASDCLEDSVCREAFRILDRNCDGKLTVKDLEGIIDEGSADHSRATAGITFEEFAEVLESCFRSAGMSSTTSASDDGRRQSFSL